MQRARTLDRLLSQTILRTFYLGMPDHLRRVQDLAVKIGQFHNIPVKETNLAHTSTSQVGGGWAPQPTDAYNEH